ncbi:MAG: glycosyltransferase, partial [Coprothermobacterota bacterium]|nr:glycosyltransferase [Coprothermobacterota bacterium]
GLEEKIVLMGFQQSISSLLVGLDVFVLSSRFEGLPLTIIEAMFAGLPVIGAAVGGNAEAVEQDRGGFLVPPNDQQALASAMMALADNKQLRLEMGLYNSERALAEFSVDNMLGKYEELYLQR